MDEYYVALPSDAEGRTKQSFHAGLIGVHIRMNTESSLEVPELDPTNSSLVYAKAFLPYRISCHYEHFVKRMLKEAGSESFFLVADTDEAVAKVLATPELQGRVFILKSACRVRDARCTMSAAAELMLFSQTRRQLTSMGSAFSEVGARVGTHSRMSTSSSPCEEPREGWVVPVGAMSRLQLRQQLLSYMETKGQGDLEELNEILKSTFG
jgi:hypothetical protein